MTIRIGGRLEGASNEDGAVFVDIGGAGDRF